jgi:hypothetical protein
MLCALSRECKPPLLGFRNVAELKRKAQFHLLATPTRRVAAVPIKMRALELAGAGLAHRIEVAYVASSQGAGEEHYFVQLAL